MPLTHIYYDAVLANMNTFRNHLILRILCLVGKVLCCLERGVPLDRRQREEGRLVRLVGAVLLAVDHVLPRLCTVFFVSSDIFREREVRMCKKTREYLPA